MWQQWLPRLGLLLANQAQILPPGLLLSQLYHSFHSVSILDIVHFQAIAKGLLGSVMIDLDGGGPIPPARLVCRLEDGGETVVTEVEHDLKEETKVDGFQEPGSFSQRVTYHASKEVRINFNIFIVICGGSPQ